MSGGSLAILGSPSTIFVSFAYAFILVFDRAFATLRSNRYAHAARLRRPLAYEPRSTRNARTTMNHSKPKTSLVPVLHTTA